MKFLKFLGAKRLGLRTAERRFEILKFLSAKRFSLWATAEFLNFTPASHNGFEILKFVPEPLRNRFEILKFTLAPHKFKAAPIPLLNFISNFTPPASAYKFENGVKFKGAAKFKRGAR